jgi:hypothetical protein
MFTYLNWSFICLFVCHNSVGFELIFVKFQKSIFVIKIIHCLFVSYHNHHLEKNWFFNVNSYQLYQNKVMYLVN